MPSTSPQAGRFVAILATATVTLGCMQSLGGSGSSQGAGVVMDITPLIKFADKDPNSDPFIVDDPATSVATKQADLITTDPNAAHDSDTLNDVAQVDEASGQLAENDLVAAKLVQLNDSDEASLPTSSDFAQATEESNNLELADAISVAAAENVSDVPNYGNVLTVVLDAGIFDNFGRVLPGSTDSGASVTTASTKKAVQGEMEVASLPKPTARKVAQVRKSSRRKEVVATVNAQPKAVQVDISAKATSAPAIIKNLFMHPLPPSLETFSIITQSTVSVTDEKIASVPAKFDTVHPTPVGLIARATTASVGNVAVVGSESHVVDNKSIVISSAKTINGRPVPVLSQSSIYVASLPAPKMTVEGINIATASSSQSKTKLSDEVKEVKVSAIKVNIAGTEGKTEDSKSIVVSKVETAPEVKQPALKVMDSGADQAADESNALLKEAARLAETARVQAAAQESSVASAPSSFAPDPDAEAQRFLPPVSGKIIANFGFNRNGWHNDGVNIATKAGENVGAAAEGRVIYVGDDLAGFGNLVLVRHSDNYVSAYAHADKILVKRGQFVEQGETIATVGNSGSVSTPQLHFEIRHGTQPINPTKYLRASL